MSAGLGVQQKDKVGYDLLASNGDIKSVIVYISTNLGMVSVYDPDLTEFIIEAFEMDKELADYFRGKTGYNNQEIGGVLGLSNAADLIYYIFQKI